MDMGAPAPLQGWTDVAGAARELDVTDGRVRQLVRAGLLRAVRIGARTLLVERASVDHYNRTRRPAHRPRSA